jgi:hypothetical protein
MQSNPTIFAWYLALALKVFKIEFMTTLVENL